MSQPPTTRASLILRLRHPDDAAAWEEFVAIYQPLIFRLAKSRGLQDADAFDVAQEVLARVAGAINRWDPDPDRGSFRGWIGRITRNLAIDFLKPLINAKQNSTFKFCSLIFLDLFFFRRQAPLHRHQRERSAVLSVVVIECVVPPTTIGFLMLDQDFGKHRSILAAVFGLQLIDA